MKRERSGIRVVASIAGLVAVIVLWKDTPALLAEDALIFGVRMNAGVDLAGLRARFPSAPWDAVGAEIARLADAGVAELPDGHLRLTPRGRLIADAVGAELMQAFSGAAAT